MSGTASPSSKSGPRFTHPVKIVPVDEALTAAARTTAEAAANFTSMSEKQYLENARPLEIRRRFWDFGNVALTGIILTIVSFSGLIAHQGYGEGSKIAYGVAAAAAAAAVYGIKEMRKEWQALAKEVSDPAYNATLLKLVDTDPETLSDRDRRFLDRVAQRAKQGVTFVLSR